MNRSFRKLADRTAEYIGKHRLLKGGESILVAVSGGPDSIALLDILTQLKDDFEIKQITVAHFDHRLRGEESDSDREFVREIAAAAGLDFLCGSADVRSRASSNKISIEMAARACRHSFFREAVRDAGACAVALGHTAEDQAEEVLLRLLRGAGPAGLKGMLPAGPDGIIRPLLFATREEITEHLLSRGISCRLDSSNFEPFCRRNSLRLNVFPALREIFNADISRTVARFADLARDEQSWWDIQVKDAWDRCARPAAKGAAFDRAALRQIHPALLRRLLRSCIEKVRGNLAGIQAVHLEPLVEMVFREMPGKSIRLPGGVEAVQQSGELRIRTGKAAGIAASRTLSVEIAGPGRYEFGGFLFEISAVEGVFTGDFATPRPREIAMDARKVKWPLEISYWKPGDRFRPLGMKGTKKLQDFFTDSKIPREHRHAIPILRDSEKICWVAGLRMDDRVKPEPHTGDFVTVRLTGA